MSVLVASPMQMDLDTLEPFLVRVSEMMPGGFGEMEIAQVVGTAERLRPGEEDELAFHIEYQGEPSRFRITMRKGDGETPEVKFFAPGGLAELIEAEIKRLDADN